MYLVDWWPGYDMRFKLLKRPTFLPVVRAEKGERIVFLDSGKGKIRSHFVCLSFEVTFLWRHIFLQVLKKKLFTERPLCSIHPCCHKPPLLIIGGIIPDRVCVCARARYLLSHFNPMMQWLGDTRFIPNVHLVWSHCILALCFQPTDKTGPKKMFSWTCKLGHTFGRRQTKQGGQRRRSQLVLPASWESWVSVHFVTPQRALGVYLRVNQT